MANNDEQKSKLLKLQICEEISQAGYISFSRYMELALYHPTLGYYTAVKSPFGVRGDFITAPEISPLFARSLAKPIQQVLASLSGGDILEIGAGSGKLASDLLCYLEEINSLPDHYYILEISVNRRKEQHEWLEQQCPHLVSKIHWLEELPKEPISGVVIANEMLDAMPVNCFTLDQSGLKERVISLDKNELSWQIVGPSAQLNEALTPILASFDLPYGYQSEINLALPDWIHQLSNSLKCGMLLFADYGFGQREYYHPDRIEGTLMCYYQHKRHADPLFAPGLQDITAHVDFSRVAESASIANLSLAGYTTQAMFLLDCGILDESCQSSLSTLEKYKLNQAIKLLTLPSQMGEAIKVIALSKEIELPLIGFRLNQRYRDLA